VGHKAIPRCHEAIERLRGVPNIHIRFVTNNSKESKAALMKRLGGMDFKIPEHEIYSCLNASTALLGGRKPFYFLTEDALKDMPIPHNDESTADTVVMGLAENSFDYENMNKAFRILRKENAQLICCNLGRYHKTANGNSIGPGAFAKGLEYSTGISPRVVGKPCPDFYKAPLLDLNLQPNQAVMIGDDANDDVNGALATGLSGILVKTGKYVPGDENKCPNATHHASDLYSAVDFMLKNNLFDTSETSDN